MKTVDSISLSFRTIKGNRLRTAITVIIMALGIMALIAIITAVDAVNNSLTESFSTMGANAFSIRYKERMIQFGGGKHGETKLVNKNSLKAKASSEGRVITYDQAKLFKQNYSFPAKVSIALSGPNNIVVNSDLKKTNPDVRVMGGDENYLALGGYTIATGRNFNQAEVENGENVCIIGEAVSEKLYDDPQKAIDKIINVANIHYRVIGVMQSRGSSAFFNADKIVITTYNNIRRIYGTGNQSYSIAIMVNDFKMMDVAVGEAIGAFRPIRKLDLTEDDNFYIDKSDSIASTLINSFGILRFATLIIAFITLIGAAIGLMNIMLVAVNERTKEIGLIKAIGGKSADVKAQFLWESILISLMGALFGIIAGVICGNLVAILVKTSFIIPWLWIIGGIAVCTLVGILAGLYPAYKAASLNPIEALRYE
ncbi:ABC transporter permease [Ferruginibacter albus]|uniref:ABC transporter permease n=1 Tax=Ferruginibacter albus TaxID=2875540 RepID=UPI001CC789D7|nr:ABC transporter permease [Ferruginibacter albus]UAY51570.1 ABC transporter permease [Ferruginibacter albus]